MMVFSFFFRFGYRGSARCTAECGEDDLVDTGRQGEGEVLVPEFYLEATRNVIEPVGPVCATGRISPLYIWISELSMIFERRRDI